jgi:tetratricopeptide (TPR) repeat protein
LFQLKILDEKGVAMSVTTSAALNLDEEFAEGRDREGRVFVGVRRKLDVGSFGATAVRAAASGTDIVREHDELGPGSDRHEELYFVASGHAAFTVDGEEIDAPAGTFVFVRDPETKRAAVTKDDDTTLLILGGRPGQPWRVPPGEALYEFFPLHEAKDYEGAAAVARDVLEDFPGNGLALYNLACCESLLGRSEDALTHLKKGLKAAPSLVDNARTDEDFVAIRDDDRFKALVAEQ